MATEHPYPLYRKMSPDLREGVSHKQEDNKKFRFVCFGAGD
jgi:hypothetical protein